MSEIPEDRKDEYIDHLHDRIQFLEQELRKSEQTVLELRQRQTTSIDVGKAADLTAEDLKQFEDQMIHAPEEVLKDTEKAFEELRHAAKQLRQEEEKLDTVAETVQEMRENNKAWFEED